VAHGAARAVHDVLGVQVLLAAQLGEFAEPASKMRSIEPAWWRSFTALLNRLFRSPPDQKSRSKVSVFSRACLTANSFMKM
jgi:hypothetical protein